MGKSNYRPVLLRLLSSTLLFFILFAAFQLNAQIQLRGSMLYDVEEGWSEKANVKVLQDNKVYEEMETSKKGRFKILLPLGHDYLIEVAKEYHFTTRFAISTKMPPEKLAQNPFLDYTIEGDLIRNFEGLDGSIMDKPILIYRYIKELDGFEIDTAHLAAVRDRVERLMSESEKLKKKGADPIAKPLPKKAKMADVSTPEIKEAPIVEEEQMISGTSHEIEENEVEKKPKPVSVPVVNEKPKEVIKEDDSKAQANETYEMEMRRQRLEREKKRKENLALKRGYESSLIRQVAEENRKMSQAELQKKTQEKEDSSMIEKAKKEAEIKKARIEHKEEERMRNLQASENKQAKSKMESGMIRDVAASTKIIQAKAIATKKAEGQETTDGQKYILDPKVRENLVKDDFKKVENLFVDYPSYGVIYSKETYNFGMVNYYIDNQAVEKEEFCKGLDNLKSYKFKLSCN